MTIAVDFDGTIVEHNGHRLLPRAALGLARQPYLYVFGALARAAEPWFLSFYTDDDRKYGSWDDCY